MTKFRIILAASALAATTIMPAMAQVGVPYEVPQDPNQWFCKGMGRDQELCWRPSDGKNIICSLPYPGLPQQCMVIREGHPGGYP
jgi:hypothetical protein